jgi:alpha-L-fucosidase 2
VSIERRLANGGHTNWSAAWLVNLWARLGDDEKAGEMLDALLRRSTLPNLLDDHPPFQIDGSFGGAAGICEMLLQSHPPASRVPGEIVLLPALPPSWSEGEFSGWKARGGVEVSARWSHGTLTSLRLLSATDQQVRVRCGSQQVLASLRAGEEREVAGELGAS